MVKLYKIAFIAAEIETGNALMQFHKRLFSTSASALT